MTTTPDLTVTVAPAIIATHFETALSENELLVRHIANLKDFSPRIKHVLYFLRKVDVAREASGRGLNAMLAISDNGGTYLTLSPTLNQFWGYWETSDFIFPDHITEIVTEISQYFTAERVRREEDYTYYDGMRNDRAHRAMRSVMKCSALKETFGLVLHAAEG